MDFDRIIFPALLCLVLAGCAPAVLQYNPLPDEGGARGWSLQSHYGMGDPIEAGRKALEDKSLQLCPGGYRMVREQSVERRTAWGTHNGQYDLIWEVRCKS